MFDERKFRAAIELVGLSMRDVAQQMDMSVVTLYRKISGKSDFYRDEIQRFQEIIGASGIPLTEIFFAEKVT